MITARPRPLPVGAGLTPFGRRDVEYLLTPRRRRWHRRRPSMSPGGTHRVEAKRRVKVNWSLQRTPLLVVSREWIVVRTRASADAVSWPSLVVSTRPWTFGSPLQCQESHQGWGGSYGRESPLLVMTGTEYGSTPFQVLHDRLCTALRGDGPRLVLEGSRPDATTTLVFDGGSCPFLTLCRILSEVLLAKRGADRCS
jgi:hypothetical protein